MVKTQIIVCCDKCGKEFRDDEKVYGYLNNNEDFILIHEDCFEDMRLSLINKIQDIIINFSFLDESVKTQRFYINEIREFIEIKRLKAFFDIDTKNYFYITISGIDYLILHDYKSNNISSRGVYNIPVIVSELGKIFIHDKLSIINMKLKEEKERRHFMDNMVLCSASSTSDITSITSLE